MFAEVSSLTQPHKKTFPKDMWPYTLGALGLGGGQGAGREQMIPGLGSREPKG